MGDTSADTARPEDTGSPPGDSGAPVEACDGIDNDGDGQVDEGFGDADDDGVADCVDEACELRTESAETGTEVSTCDLLMDSPIEPWNVEVWWEYRSPGGCHELAIADLDADGTAEILCSDLTLDVVSGVTGELLWATTDLAEDGTLSIADLDADGFLEIVGFDRHGYLIAVDYQGRLVWRSTDLLGPDALHSYGFDVQVFDLDGDGTSEVIGHKGVVDGSTGVTLALIDSASPSEEFFERELAVIGAADDETGSIVDRSAVFGADGMKSADLGVERAGSTISPVIFRGLNYPDPSVARFIENRLWLGALDGSTFEERGLGVVPIPYPCAGDVDGDGEVELMYADEFAFNVLGPDGSREWNVQVLDASHAYFGCTTFDFDLDGAKEIVFGDGEDLYILRGDGEVLFKDPGWGSVTIGEYPRVVDLDGDGSVEIVVNETRGDGWGYPAVTVYHNVHRDWPPGTQLWPSSNWSGTSLNLDGTVPRTADKPWETTLVWRGQPEYVIPGADLFPKVVDACAATCDDDATVRISARLGNLGPEEGRDATVAVYAEAADGTRSLLTVADVGWIDEDTLSGTVEVNVPLEAARTGLVFVAGDDGTGALSTDCDEGNNEVSWRFADCDAR